MEMLAEALAAPCQPSSQAIGRRSADARGWINLTGRKVARPVFPDDKPN